MSSVVTFQNLAKQNKFQAMLSNDKTVGLAEWIIDDTLREMASTLNGIISQALKDNIWFKNWGHRGYLC